MVMGKLSPLTATTYEQHLLVAVILHTLTSVTDQLSASIIQSATTKLDQVVDYITGAGSGLSVTQKSNICT